MKHYARGHNQDDDLRTPEEECTENDKDDWQIDMPDGDEIDDIEKASVDNGLSHPKSHPRTRPRLSSWTGIVKEILRYICYVKGLKNNNWKYYLRYVKSN